MLSQSPERKKSISIMLRSTAAESARMLFGPQVSNVVILNKAAYDAGVSIIRISIAAESTESSHAWQDPELTSCCRFRLQGRKTLSLRSF